LNKFKQFITELSSIEGVVDTEIEERKKMYETLMNQINQLNQDLSDEERKSKKTLMYLNIRLDNFNKTNQKAFEKLKSEREASEKKLQEYLKQESNSLIKKSTSINI
jgi:hypothetical protein